jgi:hypothetical protein
MNRKRASLLLCLALCVAGCDGKDAGRPDAGHPPAPSDAATPPPDASLAPDASTVADAATAEPDAATPARALVPTHLLGDTPLDNGMLDPDLNDLSTWYFYRLSDYSTPAHYRSVQPRSPAGLPALRIEEAGSTQGVVAMTYAFGGKGPFTASVWLGQPARTATPGTLSAQVEALDANGTEAGSTSFDLAADDSTTQTIGVIQWTQFTAKIDTELLGWAILYVFDDSGGTLYLTAPVLVQDKARMLVPPKPGRPLTLKERETLKHMVEDSRRRMPINERLMKRPKAWPTHR